MKNFVFGAGGHGKVVCDILQAAGYEVTAFVDEHKAGSIHFGRPVVSEKGLPANEKFGIVVAIGVNHVRAEIATRLASAYANATFLNAIHPSATLSASAKLGRGNVVGAGAIVGVDAIVGDHCVVNTGAQIDHDCKIGSFASLAPGVVLGGSVVVGESSYVALGAKVIHSVQIGSHAVIGAGSVVVKAIGDNVVAYGNPCRVVRAREKTDGYL